MKTKTTTAAFLLYLSSISLCAQTVDILQQINKDVWSRFYMAYESLDHKISEKIHTKDLMRIPANQGVIMDYRSYMDGIKSSFENAAKNSESRHIELRFFERLANDSTASERGVYKFAIDKGSDRERNYYGQFHVIHIKRDGKWKIHMDYDSNENNSIDEEDFQSAHAIDDFEWLSQ